MQVLVALPTGALAIVTGGDDLPVLATMLLGFVLAQRRQPVLSGVAMGLAGSLKLTAWPVLLLLAFAERDRAGRKAILRYSLSVLAVAGPILGVESSSTPGHSSSTSSASRSGSRESNRRPRARSSGPS